MVNKGKCEKQQYCGNPPCADDATANKKRSKKKEELLQTYTHTYTVHSFVEYYLYIFHHKAYE